VEVADEREIERALALIRKVLRGLKVPLDTTITRYEPEKVVYPVYD
jgi:hypothetical protein